ncbi:MAG: hypothetical protein Q8R38_04620 [Candidatus Omnitrophota bacterium]|nr:hypothetical protein [Candidatus Omnitrophota bacterium]
MKGNILNVIIISLIILSSFFNTQAVAQEENMDFFDKWSIWKEKYGLTAEQKEVIGYFKKVTPIFSDADSTMSRPENSPKERFDPKKALDIVNSSLKNIKKIVPPYLCDKHYKLIIETLGYIKDYQESREILGDERFKTKIKESEVFEYKIRNIQLQQLRIEEEVQKEYFNILRKVGYYDNLPKEAFDLKLITKTQKEQLEKKYKENKEY